MEEKSLYFTEKSKDVLSINSKESLWAKNGHKPIIIWLTGLSSAGKTTLANYIVSHYFKEKAIISLDGDIVREGICSDLGYSEKDRRENIRRASEVAKFLFNYGNIVVCSFITPFKEQRNKIKKMFPDGSFLEVFVSCPLWLCEERDVKGLYKKVKECKIKNFTGIDSPYEVPETPDLIVETDRNTIEECAIKIINEIDRRI